MGRVSNRSCSVTKSLNILPVIQNAVSAVKQWADLGGNRSEAGAGNPFKKQRPSFDEQYPRIDNPVRLNDQQIADLMPRLVFVSVGKNEVDLSLSRTPANTDPANVAAIVSAIITHWRAEHPDDADAAAARKLLEGSASLAAIDSRRESARLAAEQADKEHQEFERSWNEFRLIPAKAAQLTGKIESLEAERESLSATDFDAKIAQLIELELNPRPGVVVAESVPNLLYIKQTVPIRLRVIDDLISRMKEELRKLADDNKRLAKQLDLPAHSI